MKRVFPSVFACLAFLASCTAGTHSEPTPPEDEEWIPLSALERGEARVAEARSQLLSQPIVTGGRFAFDDDRVSHVFSPVTGRVTRVLAQLGQRVRKGTPLAAIVSPDVGSAVSDEVKARADLVAAQHDFERQTKLFAVKAASSRDFETAEDNYRKAKAEEERALERLRLLRSGQIDAVTQEYTLPSHIEGRVVARLVNPGTEVQGQFSGGTAIELFTIGDIDSLWLYADVAETDLPEVRPGAPVDVRVLAYPERRFHGRVEWISSTLDPALRTARVRCSIPNREGLLKPEMYATVVIQRPPVRQLAIPRQAVVRIGDHPFVYVAAGSRPDGRRVFKRRPVQLVEPLPPAANGPESHLPVDPGEPDELAILGNLSEGEKILAETTRGGVHAAGDISLAPEQAKSKVVTVAVEQRDVPQAITVGGHLTFDDLRVTHVFSPVGGRITRLVAKPGDHVRKGAPLAIVLSPDLGTAFSDELKARADLIAAEHELKRQREMYALKASAQRDVETAQDNRDRARAEYERAEQKTRLLRAGALGTVSQEFVLRSPIEGDVIARMASPGLEVQGQYSGASNSVELFTIGDIDRLWLLGDLYEVDLPYVRPGAELNLEVPAYPGRKFRGRVDWISDTLDPVMRTAKMRCILANPQGSLRPEMYGVVTIAAPVRHVVSVPREALLRQGDETVVFVEQAHEASGPVQFRRRKVIANEQLPGDFVPVLAGLTPGERVATRGSIFFLGM
ncbi:MAG TPA: efflux RND transporter periplasmic adaptor subunit [Anaeromyxobacteraceae bacterium]|nr:efflux RND transporter periplasmic adaptor subunit [Anaeromyxobacteraceae bacterium]